MNPIFESPTIPKGDYGSKKKCINKGLWDLNLPSELLQEILFRVGLKAKIQASAVCKTWFEASVSVRRLQPRPWLFYRQKRSENLENKDYYILFDPSKSQTYTLTFPELNHTDISRSMDGWLLVDSKIVFFLNPFTRERINLPKMSHEFLSGHYLDFSAAPTSSSCLVISFSYTDCRKYIVMATWRPRESEWTIHRFDNNMSGDRWVRSICLNDKVYCLSKCGYFGVFDPSRATWNILPTKPWADPAICQIDFDKKVLMMGHEGDTFVIKMRVDNNPLVFKLNLKHNVLEEKKSEVGGLTIFASLTGSFARVCQSAEEKNRIYLSTKGRVSEYYSLGDEKRSCLVTTSTYLSKHVAWVDPPHNNFNL